MSNAMQIAVQLWSVKDAAESDFAGTLSKLAEMGYAGVEFHPSKPRPYYDGLSPSELKKLVGGTGLIPLASHVPMVSIESNLEEEPLPTRATS